VTLSGEQIEELVTLVSEKLLIAELRRLVKFRLGVGDEKVIPPNATNEEAVFAMYVYAERFQLIKGLVEGFIKRNVTLEAPLRAIIAAAERADVASAAAVAGAPDPLAPYFPQEQPFVDRADLTRHLADLWSPGPSRVLVVRGDRFTGRSHSWLRIHDSAKTAKVTASRIDVSSNPGTWTVITMIGQIASYLGLDRTLLKDSLAQGSTQSGALLTALTVRFPVAKPTADQHCLVFDGLDRTGVDKLIIELVEAIIGKVLDRTLPGLSLILLGYGEHGEQPFGYLILKESICWLTPKLVEEWLKQVVQAAGKAAQDADIESTRQRILDNLVPPFNRETMEELRSRAKKETVELVRRL
jgi:hypothetical protein